MSMKRVAPATADGMVRGDCQCSNVFGGCRLGWLAAHGSFRPLGVAVLAVVVVLLGFRAPTAMAYSCPEHCHGMAIWNVEGKSGSGFKGADVVLDYAKGLMNAPIEENVLNDELWIYTPERNKEREQEWVEAGAQIGCSLNFWGGGGESGDCSDGEASGVFNPTSPWYFWAQTNGSGFSGEFFPLGPGTAAYEVTIYYYPPTGGWYIRVGNPSSGYVTGGANGIGSYGVKLETGVESSSTKSEMEGSAGDLDWKSLSEEWHFNDWASGSSTAHILCQLPATASWTEPYNSFQFGVNRAGEQCTGEILNDSVPAGETSSAAAAQDQEAPPRTAAGTLTTEGIKTLAVKAAAIAGDASPSSIEVAQAPRRSALALIVRGASIDDEPDISEWLGGSTFAIEMHGHFALGTGGSFEAAHPGAEVHGETLGLVVDADTGTLSAFDLAAEGSTLPSLATLGSVDAL